MKRELLIRAKEYINNLANGVNPLNGEAIPDTDITNNIKISRCLFFVSDILDEAIKKEKINKISFYIKREDLEKYEYTTEGITVSEIVKKINSLIDTTYMKKLKTTDITGWFECIGFLTKIETEGKVHKLPTELGRKMGLFTESRQGLYYAYEVVLYKRKMQEFIIDNFESLLNYIKNSCEVN